MNLSDKQKNAVLRFKDFVSFRNKISLFLSAIILVFYYLFVLGIGLFPEILAYRLGPSSITFGIMWGIFLIVLSIIATGIYTFIANYSFDKEQEESLANLENTNILEELKNGQIDYKDLK
ncbi:DUF485 domain-containing protein [Campylobacter sp. MIT 21-1685]|uniref:DUF485 domain-containing protein n=1 Tax=unclassified Campylobacter TaxID=2593542 RepID=UPI00224B85B4|nr:MULTISPECIES: DUF485 domain-containing protein [unclassified Campylobacter]MCX2683644.1 DUF485 domain-containing protein [Campylobacter sp. MIT 21-1684]MCX2751927.1 DUF485 domain-containing protein [Campylobacter sp. MIT 21-1682]MCX2808128.1 DUF485 domain-containing protein [Campylobacter sp. MIT 21-1685]